ncbi:hypothetical protein [Myxococcus sp. RHSTA-1-4]|uniref:hypothetical protein n=1 Tax=Myxococcus sp. RHSTA-1-4 TaxID=2874601 RepID=UPI001CBBC87B|nr:hypothetical protein [Myxococcus sp. RHSTA-1-4]
MRRFPLRTLLLMVVALIAFGRLYWVTHQDVSPEARPEDRPRREAPAEASAPKPLPSPECRTLSGAIEAALKAPEDAQAQAGARKRMDACPEPPERACELGTALSARAPLAAGEDAPLRGLLASLCERCPSPFNACVQRVAQGLLEGALGRQPDLADLRWSLEHAGKGTEDACDSLVKLGLAPAAQADVTLAPAVRAIVVELAPLCAKAGHLPGPVLRAAAVHQGQEVAPALVALAAGATVETAAVEPDLVTGAEPGRQAFDRDVNTGVRVSNAAPGKRWAADGALRAGYTPTLKHLETLRIRATGPGTLRAIVRTPAGVGLKDPEGGFSFVNPTVCRYQGKGQWEVCKLAVPLLDVDAVSVFPERADGEVKELEIIGAR